MRRIPSLPAVRVFEAAARHENFTEAAAELGMSQAAVSYQIRLLEERLGVPLFLRSKRRVTLTDAGRRAAPLVSGAFDTLSDAFTAIVATDEGVLNISTAQTVASNWLAPRLGAFQIQRPELAVRLRSDDRLVDFARDDVDVAIRTGRGPWPGLSQHFLFKVHATPLCSPEFRDRHVLERPEQLLDLPRLSPEDIWWKLWFAKIGIEETGDQIRPGIRLDSQVMEGNAALAGHGIGILSPLFWRSEIAAGRLVQLFPVFVFEGPCYWLVHPEHSRNRLKVKAFREWLMDEVAAEAAAGPADAFVMPDAEADS